jgi:hypothetical protein
MTFASAQAKMSNESRSLVRVRPILLPFTMVAPLGVLSSCGVLICGFPDKTTKWESTEKVKQEKVLLQGSVDYEMQVSAPRVLDEKRVAMDFRAERIDTLSRRELQWREYEEVRSQPPAPYGVEWVKGGGAEVVGGLGILVVPFEPINFLLNLLIAGESRTGAKQWMRDGYTSTPPEVVRQSQDLSASCTCDRKDVELRCGNTQVVVQVDGSDWSFRRRVAEQQSLVRNQSILQDVLRDPAKVFEKAPVMQFVTRDVFEVAVSHSAGQAIRCDGSDPDGGKKMDPKCETVRLTRYAPLVLSSAVDVIKAALDGEMRSRMRNLQSMVEDGLVVIPTKEHLEALVDEHLTTGYRNRAMEIYADEFDSIPGLAHRLVMATVADRLEQAIVPHKFKIMDIDSRSPIRAAEVQVVVESRVFQDVVEQTIAPKSVPLAMQELEQQASRLRGGQSGTTDKDGFFTIHAPADAVVDFEVVSPGHHFVKHRFTGLQTRPRSADSSLFLPADTIGVFVSNLQREKKQEVVQ